MDQGRCGFPAHAADRGSARESRTGRRTRVVNLRASAGAWAGDGRPRSASEAQIEEESEATEDSRRAGDSGARRRMRLVFWKRVTNAR
jgi:hypothetical protein